MKPNGRLEHETYLIPDYLKAGSEWIMPEPMKPFTGLIAWAVAGWMPVRPQTWVRKDPAGKVFASGTAFQDPNVIVKNAANGYLLLHERAAWEPWDEQDQARAEQFLRTLSNVAHNLKVLLDRKMLYEKTLEAYLTSAPERIV